MGMAVNARPALLAVMVLVSAAGCEFVPGSAEGRARLFVETLVREPQALERLHELVRPGAAPEELVEGVGTRVAVNYLRARARQGLALDFVSTVAQKSAAGERLVIVVVSDSGVRQADEGKARFRVYLVRDDEHDWRVARLQVD